MSRPAIKIISAIGIAGFVLLVVYGILAYFVTVQTSDGTIVDFFGRDLYPTPFLVHFVFGTDRMWTGWGWFGAEMSVFWIDVGLLVFAAKRS